VLGLIELIEKAAGVPVTRLGEVRGVALTGLSTVAISVNGLQQVNESWLPRYMAAGPE